MVTEKVKGVISCPICKKGKVIAYESIREIISRMSQLWKIPVG